MNCFYRGKIIIDILIDDYGNITFLNIDSSFNHNACGFYIFDFLTEGRFNFK